MRTPLLRLLSLSPLWLSPILADDSPDLLRWGRFVPPVFPEGLMTTTSRGGFATIAFTYDDAGRITDQLIVAASHPVFATAVLEAAQNWQIDTAGTRLATRRESFRFDFERNHSVTSLSNRDAAKSHFNSFGDLAGSPVGLCHEPELETPLSTVVATLPKFPEALKDAVPEGTVTVSFVVDVDGRVRVPEVVKATHPELGMAALVAVRDWSFTPPVRGKQPVQVTAARTLRFRRPAR